MINIKVGDRVVVIEAKGSCKCSVGRRGIVTKQRAAASLDQPGKLMALLLLKCSCGHVDTTREINWVVGYDGRGMWFTSTRLEKESPLATPESSEIEDVVTA